MADVKSGKNHFPFISFEMKAGFAEIDIQTKGSLWTWEKKAFTLLELLVVIAIIATLAGLLMPSLRNTREAAKSGNCLSNLKQIYTAFSIYANDFNGLLPPHAGVEVADPMAHWTMLLQPYGLNYNVIYCPSDPNFKPGTSTPLDTDPIRTTSYLINAFTELNTVSLQSISLWDISNLSDVIYIGEKPSSESAYYMTTPPSDPWTRLEHKRHTGSSNYLFLDGHVRSIPFGGSLTPHNLWTIDPTD